MYYLFLIITLLGEPIAEVKIGPIQGSVCREQVKTITLTMPENFQHGNGEVMAGCIKETKNVEVL